MNSRITRKLMILCMAVGLATFAACSDDAQPTNDSAVIDQALADLDTRKDGKPDRAADLSLADKALHDSKPKPDIKPDAATSLYWQEVKSDLTSRLRAVYGTSATDVYAVGDKGVILKYNGSTWSSMTNPDTNNTDLWGLTIHPYSSSNYLYAVGAQITLYYDGSAWNKGYSYSTSAYYNFRDVWSPASSYNKIGVGEMGYYISYYTSSTPSSSWSYTYLYSSLNDSLYGVWGSSISQIFAVGDNGTIMKCTSNCTAYTSGWGKDTSPTTNHLRDIYGFSSTDIWAVGFGGTVLHHNGSSWSKVTVPTSTYFYGIWGTSSSNLYVVGHPYFKTDESIWHYNGTTWKKLAPPRVSYLNAIWGASDSEVFVVGNYNILKLKQKP